MCNELYSLITLGPSIVRGLTPSDIMKATTIRNTKPPFVLDKRGKPGLQLQKKS